MAKRILILLQMLLKVCCYRRPIFYSRPGRSGCSEATDPIEWSGVACSRRHCRMPGVELDRTAANIGAATYLKCSEKYFLLEINSFSSSDELKDLMKLPLESGGAFLLEHSAICDQIKLLTFQGSAAICLRYDENRFIGNVIFFAIWSSVKIWQSYGHELVVRFGTRCRPI